MQHFVLYLKKLPEFIQFYLDRNYSSIFVQCFHFLYELLKDLSFGEKYIN